jgi:hypothetical protein
MEWLIERPATYILYRLWPLVHWLHKGRSLEEEKEKWRPVGAILFCSWLPNPLYALVLSLMEKPSTGPGGASDSTSWNILYNIHYSLDWDSRVYDDIFPFPPFLIFLLYWQIASIQPNMATSIYNSGYSPLDQSSLYKKPVACCCMR